MISIKLRESIKKINLTGLLLQDEPLAHHCTFRVGGPAALMHFPSSGEDLARSLRWARDEGVPTMVLGGGANVVPSDRGFAGLVVCTTALDRLEVQGSAIHAGPGIPVSTVAAKAADAGLGGMDFIYAMPGSLAGAVYMNARCYHGEISAVVHRVRYLDEGLTEKEMTPGPQDWSYKVSPFTHRPWIILDTELHLTPADPAALWPVMKGLEDDRRSKGHFAWPCAGSVFKNNRDFGAPTGKILDGLSVRGHRRGGIAVSDLHANIIVNDRNGKAEEIRQLVAWLMERTFRETGFALEPEILFVGDWTDDEQAAVDPRNLLP